MPYQAKQLSAELKNAAKGAQGVPSISTGAPPSLANSAGLEESKPWRSNRSCSQAGRVREHATASELKLPRADLSK